MRTIIFRAIPGLACALMLSGCAYEHPGPTFSGTDEALPSSPDNSTPAAPISPARTAASAPSPSKQAQTRSTHPNILAVNNSALTVPATAPMTKPANQPVIPLFPVKPDRTPSSASPENGDTGSGTDSSFDNLEVVDASLKGKLAVLRVGSEPTPNNLLSVFVGLKNKTSHQLNLEMQTVYKDKTGNELNSGSWIAMTLKPHEETEYRSASISAEATDFMIRIRRAVNAGTEEAK